MLDRDECSNQLFGRFDALALYLAIAALPKEAFTTGELAKITEVGSPTISKELGRLKSLGLVKSMGRRGQYERCPSCFWALVEELVVEWDV